MPIQVQEASRTPNRNEQNRTTTRHIIIKTTNTENIEGCKREKTKKHTKVNPSKSQQISQ
jgi:hypothetical protein